jgi:2-hydroxycyclohexanecarboxyl-CoA dehydrogenase
LTINWVKRTALVTGGGSGLGEAISHRLARDGLAVGVLDISGDKAQSIANAIRDQGGRAVALRADVANRREVNSAVGELRDAFGPVTVLINNAGIDNFSPVENISEESWDRILNVNLKGIYIVTQAVLADMVAAGWGRIVNMSALGAQIGAPHMLHYSASKGGIMAMTRSLATELGPKGITVNSVSPGIIDTPMVRRAAEENKFPVSLEQLVANYPIPRLGRPEDVAAACAFLVSEEAAYITAQTLGVNGGAAV